MNEAHQPIEPSFHAIMQLKTDRRDKPLHQCVEDAVRNYLEQLGDTPTSSLYALVMAETERPLLRAVMEHCRGNQSQAARLLGISRGKLRKMLEAGGEDR